MEEYSGRPLIDIVKERRQAGDRLASLTTLILDNERTRARDIADGRPTFYAGEGGRRKLMAQRSQAKRLEKLIETLTAEIDAMPPRVRKAQIAASRERDRVRAASSSRPRTRRVRSGR